MFGVIRLIFDEDVESMSGDDDFFSVARTIPLVAKLILAIVSIVLAKQHTLNTQRGNTLVDGIQGVFCLYVRSVRTVQ